MQVIPGLPDELALRCLGRVARTYDHILNAVCKAWRELVLSPELHRAREESGAVVSWIYVSAAAPDRAWQAYVSELDRWMPLPRLPTRLPLLASFATAVVGHRLFVIGGFSQQVSSRTGELVNPHATTDVWILDAVAKAWAPGPPLPLPGLTYVCAAVGGSIYAMTRGASCAGPLHLIRLCTKKLEWSCSSAPDMLGFNLANGFALGGRLFQPTKSEADTPVADVCDAATAAWSRKPYGMAFYHVTDVGAVAMAAARAFYVHDCRWIRELHVGAAELSCSANLTPLPRGPREGPLYGAQLVALGPRLVLLGGSRGLPGLATAPSNRADAWDPRTDVWTGLRHMGPLQGTVVAAAVLTA